MKKTVFALQVFGLVALLPVIVMLEINHHTTKKSLPHFFIAPALQLSAEQLSEMPEAFVIKINF